MTIDTLSQLIQSTKVLEQELRLTHETSMGALKSRMDTLSPEEFYKIRGAFYSLTRAVYEIRSTEFKGK